MDYYYFDVIRILSTTSHVDLKNILDIENLKLYCGNIIIKDTFNRFKYHEYLSEIHISVATEKFMEFFKNYDFGNSIFTKIEVSRDTKFDTFDTAKQYIEYLDKITHKKWSKDRWVYYGPENNTYYIGTSENSPTKNYIRMYPNEGKVFTNENVGRIEFSILRTKNINRALKIKHINALQSPKCVFKYLEKKYIIYCEVDEKKYIKYLTRLGLDYKTAEKSVELGNGVGHFFREIKEKKSGIVRKIHLAALSKYYLRKNKKITNFEKSFLKINPNKFLIPIKTRDNFMF